MRRTVSAALLLVLAGAAAACDRDQDRQEVIGKTPATTLGDDTTANAPPEPVTPVVNADTATVTGNLVPINNSGVNGSIALKSQPPGTLVTLHVANVPTGNDVLTASIVEGDCTSDRAVASLPPLKVDPARIATATDTVAVEMRPLLDGKHRVVVKGEKAGAPTPPFACANLPTVPAGASFPLPGH